VAIYKLKASGNDLANAELVEASKTTLDLEKHLESWLERSPLAIAQEPLLVIGRQTSAHVEGGIIFPDLLALDSEGNLVIVELKKGRAPREVTTQLLEYAAWASELTNDEIVDCALSYFGVQNSPSPKHLEAAFFDMFEVDELPPLNQRLRLFLPQKKYQNPSRAYAAS